MPYFAQVDLYDYDDHCLSGAILRGDTFDPYEIEAWFAHEREGYSTLNKALDPAPVEDVGDGTYGHHLCNTHHGFRFLPSGRIPNALGIGSAYGHEFQPIADRIDNLTILEPGSLRSKDVYGVPIRYVDPDPSGDIPFPDGTFDLITSFGTLHHIPNVSHVVGEMGRVTAQGGWVLAREPIRSMGDWRQPRRGLTKNERGIPRPILHQAFVDAGFTVVKETPCFFPTYSRLNRYKLGLGTQAGIALDQMLSALTTWNDRYHSTKPWHKVHATCVAIAARKR
jgi:SAM-dependent methyltransferase